MSNPNPRAVIFGCSGLALTDAERRFFADTNPFGFILFGRNCDTPDQVRHLVDELKSSLGRDAVPILIDQEGGRVARLTAPNWPTFPPAMTYADLYAENQDLGVEAALLGGQLIAAELFDLGITVDCAPVLDVPQSGSDPIIGDRAFGRDLGTIVTLAGAFMNGLARGGVDPVIKHIPGHGRALVDSHLDLPIVDAEKKLLQGIDFPPFKALNTAPWAMTAHVIYTVLDSLNPATTSALVIQESIRKIIGFKGLLMSDDLSMNALSGSLQNRAEACMQAGCDMALHCNGKLDEMVQVAEGTEALSDDAFERFTTNDAHRIVARQDFDRTHLRARFDELLGALG